MRFDNYVFARMRNWNPQLDWTDREAVIAAWHGSANFDRWHSGMVVARAQTMIRHGFVEVLGEDGNTYEWKKL